MSRIEWEMIGRERRRVSRWSGGTTAEIAIHPATSQYAARNFAWRVSTATVEAETTDFTPLDGFSRILMVLEDELTLRHEGHGTYRLRPYEQNAFEGCWKTSSEGRATDFNLIYASRLRAGMSVLKVPGVGAMDAAVGSLPCEEGEQWIHRIWYAVEGSIEIAEAGENSLCRLDAGEALLLAVHRSHGEENWSLRNAASGQAVVIESVVFS